MPDEGAPPPSGGTALEPERRAALLAAKVGALVAGAWGDEPRTPATFPGGAALRDDRRGWVLVDDEPSRSLGRALVWAEREGVELHVLAEEAHDVLARRAAQFDRPATVHRIAGRRLEVAPPASPPPPASPSADALRLAARFVDAGADVVVEHGQLLAEVDGLEVARVVEDEHGLRIEVGVGRHDREAFAMVHGGLTDEQALASAVGTVRRHRRPGAPSHPLNRLVPERWMRRWLLDHPHLVGAATLEPVEPPARRRSLQDVEPAFAVGVDAEGPVVVACSVGIDLELVPAAADVRAVHSPDARLVLALPERDAVPVTRRLAASLVRPAEVVTPGDGWRLGTAVA